jgi:thymidine kinase
MKKTKEKKILKICDHCAKKRHMVMEHNHIASYWTDICDVCGEEKYVTDPQDFKYLIEEY